MVSFGQHEYKLQKLNKIDIPPEIIIGAISYLDIDNLGNLLITDQMSKSVLLFNKSSMKFKNLSTVKCTPGFNWRPIYSIFNGNNILVINSLPWGYKFYKNGDCYKPMSYKFIAPSFIINASESKLVGYYNDDKGNILKMMDEDGNVLFTFGEFQKKFKNFIKRFSGGGLTTDEKGKYIFKMDVHSPVLHKYDLKGRLVDKKTFHLLNFHSIDRDIKDNTTNPILIIKDLKIILEGKSTIKNFAYYSNEKFIIVTLTNKKQYIHLVNINGEVLFESEIPEEISYLNSKNGLLYFVEQPFIKNSDILPNPQIILYEIK